MNIDVARGGGRVCCAVSENSHVKQAGLLPRLIRKRVT